ncbi:hypothetical protein ACEWY4_005839 [Coilia grayii]|uniref:Tumor necrosis factor alpha-induced protein 2-like n=1 Tax=Coilia grayii TaxID=363190 RepID=A0ABD1KJI7_9TELE
MRSLQSHNAVTQALQAARAKVSNPLTKYMPRLPAALRRNSKTPSIGSPESPESPDTSCAEVQQVVPSSFEENLERRCFSEASRQLIGREERLFRRGQQEDEAGQRRVNNEGAELRQDDEEESGLRWEYEALLEGIRQTVGTSLHIADQSERDALKEAVLAMQQEEEQDKRWAEPNRQSGIECPHWRPLRIRHIHNSVLEEMVKGRVQGAEPHKGGGSSIQRELIGLGQRIKRDLLQVCRQVRGCYPGDEDVVRAYARLYHQTFSAHLRNIADFGLDHVDTTHLLNWILHHYPSILQEPELVSEVNVDWLGPLLPPDVMEPLLEQYLQHRQDGLQSCLEKTLKREELAWRGGAPEMVDSCYFSPLAIDVIQFVDDNLKAVHAVLGDKTHIHRMLSPLPDFFISYQDVLQRVLRQDSAHDRSVVMANLSCLRMFREFVTGQESFPEDVRNTCVSLITNMADSCHAHLITSIHLCLKDTYRKLWTSSWLQKSVRVREQLSTQLRTHLQNLQAVEHNSRQELLLLLHECVLVEYVRRMLKKKLKLKDRKQQEQAAAAMCDDNQAIHTLFTNAGCTVGWRNGVLPVLGELLRLQDPDTISLELLTLTTQLPDISMGHFSALLQLKSNLSDRDCRNIKKTFTELMKAQLTHTSHTHTPAHAFFSKVTFK